MTTYQFIDTVTNQDEVVKYSTECLNSLNLHGMPPHVLILKFGALIISLLIYQSTRTLQRYQAFHEKVDEQHY